MAPANDLPLPPRDLEILLSLHRGSRHAYGIMQDVAERTGGRVTLATSTLYSSVRRLLTGGLIQEARAGSDESGGPPRRYYAITSKGRAALRAEAARVTELANTFKDLGVIRGEVGP